MIPWTWAFVTILCILCSAQAVVVQPDEVITVALGNTVTLRCYSDKDDIFWYKQIAGQQPRVMSAFYKVQEPIFYREFKKDRFQGKRLSSSSNLTISGIIQSDEAVYYCGSKASYIEFGSGTHLIIKVGQQDSTSKISKSDQLNDSIECQQKFFENSTKQVKNEDISEERLWPAVLGLACALGLCGAVNFALVGFIFKRVHGSGQDKQVRRQSSAQDTDDENLTYAALQFSKIKIKSGGQREKSQQSVNIIYDSLNVQ